jgi:hypothetical protein
MMGKLRGDFRIKHFLLMRPLINHIRNKKTDPTWIKADCGRLAKSRMPLMNTRGARKQIMTRPQQNIRSRAAIVMSGLVSADCPRSISTSLTPMPRSPAIASGVFSGEWRLIYLIFLLDSFTDLVFPHFIEQELYGSIINIINACA